MHPSALSPTCCSLLCAVALLFAPRAARAQDPLAPVGLTYDAPPGCPLAESFIAAVEHAVPRVQFGDAAKTHGRHFMVSISSDGRRGRLSIEDDGAPMGRRDVEAASCSEVAEVLAFAMALAIDPTAKPAPSSGPAPTTPAFAPPAAVQAAPSSAPPSPPSRGVGWEMAVHGVASVAGSPGAMFGLGGTGTLRLARVRSASVRAGFEYSASAPVSVEGARVSFSRVGGLLEACVTEWRFGALSIRPCTRFDMALRTAAAEDIAFARSVGRAWLTVGPTAHVRWAFAGPLFVDLGAGLPFALVRDRVILAPDITVHEVPLIGGAGEIGVGLEFP